MIDCGNQIDIQTHNKVVNIFSLLLNKPIQGVINIHPAYNSLMLSLDYDVDILDVVKKIKILISDNTFIEKELKRNIVNIPVCYDPSIYTWLDNAQYHIILVQRLLLNLPEPRDEA